MANRCRMTLLKGGYHKPTSLILPLVTNLHPATTVLTKITKSAFAEASSLEPSFNYILPKKSLIVAYRKLPSLQLLLCKNDQNSLINTSQPVRNYGYLDTGCRCLVCQTSIFSKSVRSPSLPGYYVKIPATTTCRSGPGVIYHIVCHSHQQHCKLAHYVGRAWCSDFPKPPMAPRWYNHRSHFKHSVNKCKLTDHLLKYLSLIHI